MRSALKSGQQARGAGQKNEGETRCAYKGRGTATKTKKKKEKKWEVGQGGEGAGVRWIRQKGTNLLIL